MVKEILCSIIYNLYCGNYISSKYTFGAFVMNTNLSVNIWTIHIQIKDICSMETLSLLFSEILCWHKWHFWNNCIKFLLAYFKFDKCSIFSKGCINITHGYILVQCRRWTATSQLPNLGWPIFSKDCSTSYNMAIRSNIRNSNSTWYDRIIIENLQELSAATTAFFSITLTTCIVTGWWLTQCLV